MNKRIQELAEQANGPNPFYGTLKNQMTLLGDDAVERFAELIVRECMGIAEENQPRDVDWNISDIIRVHFGVEK